MGFIAMALDTAPVLAAEEFNGPNFLFNGFGTLGVVHSSEDKADFASNFLKPNGAGYTRAWSADVDSRLGGQVTAILTDQLSAVLQGISEQRYDNTYRPIIEWANLKYKITPDFSVRAGRIALSTFLAADYRKVGYAIPWVRPPVEVYGLVPISNSDGVDLAYRLHVAEATNTTQASYGQTKVRDDSSTTKVKSLYGFANTTEIGPATVRVSYLRGNLTGDYSRAFFDLFRQFGPEGDAIADKYDVNNKLTTFVGLGGSYDPGNWFLMAEWSKENTHSILGANTGWYASSGYRFGKFTPYLTYAQVKLDSNKSDPGLTTASLPPASAAAAASLNAALNSFLGSNAAQKTISVGTRWDFAKNIALKLQYDHIRLSSGSQGTLINTQPDFQRGGKVNLFTTVLDFVF
jgi:hypothetical protein